MGAQGGRMENVRGSAANHGVIRFLLNVAHGIDHMFLLIFATAVASIAVEFGYSNWTDLMPYGVGAFVLFGLGALPAGHLGDLWGRRIMMIIFFIGMGAAAILVAFTQNAWQLAAALMLLGAFAAIYHPVGIPMLVQNVPNPGAVIGFNGLAGNLGIAVAALLTGFLVKWLGWRAAFVIPGSISIACGIAFALLCPKEVEAPSKGKGGKAQVKLSPAMLARVFAVMTVVAVAGSLLFNFTTNGNAQLLSEAFLGVIEDPAVLGALLSVIYVVASLAQIVIGRMIDVMPFKPLQFWMSVIQIPPLIFAAHTQDWWLFIALLAVMVFVFGSIPFTEAMVVRYVDDRLRSRVAGLRLTVAFGISALAVWLLGPMVKNIGFAASLWILAGVATIKATIVLLLPDERRTEPGRGDEG
ncbi:MAG: MFS transporter [Burkholderiales bacterium]|nr:MFS transporter [Burkholderiales bacterium]MCW5605021.1 MFS transporter [Burkholderiales bacterium]